MRMWFTVVFGVFFSLSSIAAPKFSYGPEVTHKGKKINLNWPAAEAGDNEEAIRTQGYLHAKYRFLQMDMFRRTAQGRLSELLGKSQLEDDIKHTSIGLPLAVRKSVEKIKANEETWKLLEKYTEGVNAYLDEQKGAFSQLNSAYTLVTRSLSPSVRRWAPEDTVAVGLTLSFFQSNNVEEKVRLGEVYAKVFSKLDNKHFVDFRPFYDVFPIDSTVPKVATAVSSTQSHFVVNYHFECGKAAFPFKGCDGNGFVGSNAFATTPEFAEDGQTYLATDPHVPMLHPNLLFPNAIKGGDFLFQGYSVAGFPGIVFGHNGTFAYAQTSSQGDVDGVYVEKIVERDGKRFAIFQDKEVELTKIDEEIPYIEGGKRQVHSLGLWVVPHHGPIFSEHWKQLSEMEQGQALSYRWPGHDGETGLIGMFMLMRAKDFEGFKKGMDFMIGGSGNYVYADIEGNIGFYQGAKFPLWNSETAKKYPPYLPMPGNGESEWTEYRAKNSEIYNPAQGFVVVTNTDPIGRVKTSTTIDERYNDYFSYKTDPGVRQFRLGELLAENKGKLNVEVLRKMQFDHADVLAQKFVELLDGNDYGTDLGKKILAWKDYSTSRDREEPVLFYVWLYALMQEYYRPMIEAGVFEKFSESPYGVKTLYHGVRESKDRNTMLEAALKHAETHLQEKGMLGKKWGEVHRLKFDSPAAVFAGEGSPRDGGWQTVDVGGFLGLAGKGTELPTNFPNNYGPTMRMVVGLNKKTQSIKMFGIMPGGNLTDTERNKVEAELWAEGALLPFVTWQQ